MGVMVGNPTITPVAFLKPVNEFLSYIVLKLRMKSDFSCIVQCVSISVLLLTYACCVDIIVLKVYRGVVHVAESIAYEICVVLFSGVVKCCG